MDTAVDLIVSKYQNLDLPSDYVMNIDADSQLYDNFEYDDYNISPERYTDEFLEHENKYILYETNDEVLMTDIKDVNDIRNKELFIEESSHLSKCNLELVKYPNCGLISSGESTCNTSNGAGKIQEKLLDNIEIVLNKKYKVNGSGANKMQNKTFSNKRGSGAFDSKHSIHKTSRTQIYKKNATRRSNTTNVLKFDSCECKKIKLKKQKEHSMFLATPLRPIPASLIELCHSQSKYKKLEKCNTSTCQLNSNIAASEECMLGIVTRDGEEISEIRHNAEMCPEIELDILENEDVLETVINLSKDNSYSRTKIETDNVQSQTIFLFDLDEPSTSKGLRHFSTDVQCGPDVISACPTMSQTTSFTRMPKLFTTGIKIGEPSTVVKKIKNTYDYGTCTEMCDNTLTSGRNCVGIRINESFPDVTECYTMTQVIEDETTFAQLTTYDSKTESELLKPVYSGLKNEDSGSEFCGSMGSYIRSPTQLVMSSKNTSDFQIQSVSNEKNIELKISQTSYDKVNLVCGGIHVHSFKERQVSEDVVYQGEWQRKQPNRNHCSIVRKNLPPPKRQQPLFKDRLRVDEIKRHSKNVVPVGIPKPTFNNPKPLKKTIRNMKKSSMISDKPNKNNAIKKVPSKVALSSDVFKNMKTIYTTKKRKSVNKIENTMKKEEEIKKNMKIKNYLPLYLRRKIQSSTIKKNNIENAIKNSENIFLNGKLFPSLKTPEVAKNLIKIPDKTLHDYEYMIFRNEIQTEKDSNIRLPPATGMFKSDKVNRSHSPLSQHSSTCSSPNSVATVRAVSTRNKVTCNRRNSTSSEKSSSGIVESENKSSKNKKFSRRAKSNKKPTLSSMLCDNKENVPESSKNTTSLYKDIEKSAKNAFLGRTKSVFMAQMTTETSTLPLPSITLSKTKIQSFTKSLKLASIQHNTRSNDDQTFEPSTSSVFAASLDEHSKTTVPDNNVLTLETVIEPSSNDIIQNDACPIPNEADEESLNSRQSIHNTKSSIISAIRKIIENKLNIPENSYDRNDSDSETVILSRDEDYNISPTSIGTINATDLTHGSESDVDDYPHIYRTCTLNEKETSHKDAGLKSPDNESDALSVKSFASMATSKFSEYYLADNEFESTLPQVDTLNMSSIQDIFERKELNTLPNMGGVLAIQAFSGFSVNEPLTGDQPDFVNYIDSETGSFAFRSARQATSEEIFVSGRSSDTYESCYVEEDAYVPNWLFNMISQQQSGDESEADEINLPLQMPIEEPGFDMNGNVMEAAIAVGTGAGDGRGMHSDHSQDSSGRGTSLSSSETSSGPQSEAVLNDSSNFTTQVDYSREPMNMSAMIGAPSRPNASTVSNAGENNEADTSNLQSRNPRSSINPVQLVSDIEADVSSLETDAVDSDN